MKGKLFRTIFLASLMLVLVVSAVGATSMASLGVYDDPGFVRQTDNRPDPLSVKQAELKEAALEAQIHGKAQGGTHEVRPGQYVELEREGEDPVWTVLGEFSDFPHNNIPEPDRTVDNSTIWIEDFNRAYYMDMLFAEGEDVNSMRQFYIEQSSNRYTFYGDVTDWVTVPGEAASYDDGDPVGEACGPCVWQFLTDSVNGWYNAQIDAGKTPEQIDEYLSTFDVWDRYDWDEDGNFNEPDGYIDHIQFVHAGEGNEAGGGELGDYAIWSHSWFAYSNLIGIAGPSDEFLEGGIQVGNSSFWLNKYTIQPENGGVGVFAHEFGHDLGVPDLYDYTGENSTGFWTIMSSGSWLSQNDYDIGSQPNHFGAWEKLQLGWLNYDTAIAGETSVHKLGPAEYNTNLAQGLLVILPEKEIVEHIADPYAGETFYYSGAGNDIDNFMYKAFTLGTDATLAAMVNYDIESGWDYAYLVYSMDDGATWESIETSESTTSDPNGQNFGFGITGSSNGWTQLTADLPAGDMLLGFRYWTDGYVVNPGFMVDEIEITGYSLDGAEGDAGWTFDGFRTTTGTESALYSNYYVAEYRQYIGYDKGLANAYNFGWVPRVSLENYVEHFPYQDGLLISYWDNSFTDNNVGANCEAGRCGGLLLPVDAHPELMYTPNGSIWRNRIQTYDSTFSLEPTDAITLHWHGRPSYQPSQPGVRLFDDRNSYYNPENPMGSVIVPNTGTQIYIQSISPSGSSMQVEVRPAE